MDKEFLTYLIFIVVTICFFISLILIAVKKIKRRYESSSAGKKGIDSGSVSVFFDWDKNVTIIPYAQDKYGMGRAVGSPGLVAYPYKSEKLGQALRVAMHTCSTGSACPDEELMSRLSFRTWKEFSEGKRNISVHYQPEYGIVFNTTARKPDGAYQFNFRGLEKALPGTASDIELGEALLSLLPRCRS